MSYIWEVCLNSWDFYGKYIFSWYDENNERDMQKENRADWMIEVQYISEMLQ